MLSTRRHAGPRIISTTGKIFVNASSAPCPADVLMSAFALIMSALPPKADVRVAARF